MKLKPTNFFDPEPDRNAWVTRINPDGSDYMEKPHEYQQALSEWKRRQVEPEDPYIPNWPKRGYLDWFAEKDNDELAAKYRTDKDYYEQHRLRYKGWELVNDWYISKKLQVEIYFDLKKDRLVITKNQGHFVYDGAILEHLTFEALMKDNNFELEKI